ncbi:MAG: ABC transporter substrate-binding protein [Thermomicrobiales bacterium]
MTTREHNSVVSRRLLLQWGAAGASTGILGPAVAAGALAQGDAEKAESQELTIAAQFFSTGANSGDLAELDPARRGTWGFNMLLWAPLVAPTADAQADPEKSLATSWEGNAEGTVFTFPLRPEAKFSDGTPITAHDVVGTIGYLAMMAHNEAIGIRGNFGANVKRLLFDIQGMTDAVANAQYDPFGTIPVPGVTALDEHTVQITLEAPSLIFITRLLHAVGVFRPADLESARELQMDQLDFWTAHAVHSGPYKLSDAVAGDRYEMTPNEHYFGPAPQLTKITVKAVGSDPNTLLTVFSSGELDAVTVPLVGAAALQALSDPSLTEALLPVTNWVTLQLWMTPNAPLDDEHVRRAITMAVDRDTLLTILNAGAPQPLHEPTNMHRNPAIPACEDETAAVTPLPFDPAAAKEELNLSQYGAEVVDMEIHVLSREPADLVPLQAIQKMLQDNLGLTKVTIHTEQVPDLNNPPFPLHLWPNQQQPWFADIADTLWNMAFLMNDQEWTPDEPRRNISVAYEPDLKALIAQAQAESDAAARCALVGQAGQMWNDVAFSLDYGVPVTYFLINPRIEGLTFFTNGFQGMPIDIEQVFVAAD